MRCEGCGHEAAALKSCRWRNSTSDRKFPLCDECYVILASSLWVVQGREVCWGQCRLCGEWVSVRELEDRVGGGRWDAPTGICSVCAAVD